MSTKRHIIRFESPYSNMSLEFPAPGVALLRIAGTDIGEHGFGPMQELEKRLSTAGPTHLFIDARETKGASIEVSGDWAQWLGRHKARLGHICMLVGSPYIQITANFVKQFASLQDQMRIYTDERAFESMLALCTEGIASAQGQN